MKLKTIMYSLAYGRSPEALKRSEGARRVQQGNRMLEERTRLRQAAKSIDFIHNYGVSSKELSNIVHRTNVKDNSIDNLTWVSPENKNCEGVRRMYGSPKSFVEGNRTFRGFDKAIDFAEAEDYTAACRVILNEEGEYERITK